MAPAERPPWWPAFISAERVIGERLERFTRSDEFADFVVKAAGVKAALQAVYEKTTADALHRWNLPAWSDIRSLNEQVVGLERRLADLALELERRPDGGAKPRSSRRRPRSSAP